jgi:hypothetical protein
MRVEYWLALLMMCQCYPCIVCKTNNASCCAAHLVPASLLTSRYQICYASALCT